MKIKKFNDSLNEELLLLDTNLLSKMKEVYDEFGIDIHDIPSNIQSNINDLVIEIIKLRDK